MKQLWVEASDGEWCAGFAFGPQRQAFLLVVGGKSGQSQKRFYTHLIAKVDKRFLGHLDRLRSGKKEK